VPFIGTDNAFFNKTWHGHSAESEVWPVKDVVYSIIFPPFDIPIPHLDYVSKNELSGTAVL
jgi:hypothetical protein